MKSLASKVREHFGVSQREPSSMVADSAEASATLRKAAG